MPMVVPILLVALLFAGPASAGAARLRAAAEAFAGLPVLLDPRVALPDCGTGPTFTWRDEQRRVVVARCGPAQLLLPVLGSPAAVSASPDSGIRRGDRVVVEAGSGAMRATLEAVADGRPTADGRLAVRNVRTGQRLTARIGLDGRTRLLGAGMVDTNMR